MVTTPIGDGRATKLQKTFRIEYAVTRNIKASPSRVWDLLTDVPGTVRWNSTVESIEGTMAVGEKIQLRVPLAPGRTFKLKVHELVPEKKLVLRDGAAPMFKGVRTYTLTGLEDGSTEFTMVEVLNGLMLPMIAKALPDFTPSFEQYAADLKREAERAPGHGVG